MDIARLIEIVKSGELEKKLEESEVALKKQLEIVGYLKNVIKGLKDSGVSLSAIFNMFKKGGSK